MRIHAEVDIVNRLLPSLSLKGSKSGHAQLSVGRKPGADPTEGAVFLMICTAKDRNGAKYRLKDNIQNFFVKFINDGKATIRFKEPPHDVCIKKADKIHLKAFLNVVKMGFLNKEIDKVTLSSLAPASARQVEKPKTKLSIVTRKDYPLTTNFPSSLEYLQVMQCTLKRIDSRILALKHLKVLDLSNNHLKSLPEDWSVLSQLGELKLANNHLEEIPKGFCTGNLKDSLSSLDLCQNKLKILRPFFCDLTKLYSLKLDENELLYIPQGIGRLTRLRLLSVAKNQLKVLPAGFTQLSLENVDMFGNAFLENGPSTALTRLEFPTLLECAARAITNQRIPYTDEDVGYLFNFLAKAKQCLCGGHCFQSSVHYLAKVDLHRISATVVALDTSGRSHAPVEAFLCSQKCYERYQKNPYASIWKR